jgi:hypothetical protein
LAALQQEKIKQENKMKNKNKMKETVLKREVNYDSVCVKLSFWGGLSRCFTVPYPWQGSQVTITPERL